MQQFAIPAGVPRKPYLENLLAACACPEKICVLLEMAESGQGNGSVCSVIG